VLATAEALRAGGPWGPGFPEPVFDGEFRIQAARLVAERHLKLTLAAPEGRGGFDAILFNYAESASGGEPAAAELQVLPNGAARLVYRLDSNEYLGERRLQLVIEHLLPV